MTAMRRWVGSALLLAFGLATLTLSIVWGHPDDGWWALGLAAAFALVLALGGRSELLRTVRGDPDERGERVTLVTSNIVVNLMAAVGVVGAAIEQGRGVHAGPWTLACVAGGALYLVTFVVVRART